MTILHIHVPVPVWLAEVLLLKSGDIEFVDLGGLDPETTELAVLFPLCGGMGTGPLWGVGARGSITLGTVILESTEKVKHNTLSKGSTQ